MFLFSKCVSVIKQIESIFGLLFKRSICYLLLGKYNEQLTQAEIGEIFSVSGMAVSINARRISRFLYYRRRDLWNEFFGDKDFYNLWKPKWRQT